MNRTRRFSLSAALLALLLSWPIPAQETRGTIHGRVLDPTGAAVPGVTVVVENVDMNTSTRLRTNQTGYYEATLLLNSRDNAGHS